MAALGGHSQTLICVGASAGSNLRSSTNRITYAIPALYFYSNTDRGWESSLHVIRDDCREANEVDKSYEDKCGNLIEWRRYRLASDNLEAVSNEE